MPIAAKPHGYPAKDFHDGQRFAGNFRSHFFLIECGVVLELQGSRRRLQFARGERAHRQKHLVLRLGVHHFFQD
ncbi:MAG TPA: hypothetical protein VF778_14775, partial [Xanthobacteraceae bacterium]